MSLLMSMLRFQTPSTKSRGQLILISQVYYPDQQATSQLLSSLAISLATLDDREVSQPSRRFNLPSERLPRDQRLSWDVRVLSGHPSQARVGTSKAPVREVHRGVEIKRGGLKVDAKRSLVHRAVAYLSFLTWLTWQLLFRTPTRHRVLVVTNPPFAPLLVWLCARTRGFFGASFTYDVLLHDLYPDGLIALEKVREGAWWVRFWMRLNRVALCGARHVITLGRDMSRHCEETYQVPTSALRCVTNWSPVEWSEQERVRPDQTALFQELPEEARRPGVLLVQYSGNMGLWHNIDELVRAADALRDTPIHFVMIGEGRRKAAAQELAKTLALSNMTWLPFQPLDALTDSLQCAHLSLVSQRPEVLGIMVPSKLYGVLASGRGVIAQVPSHSEVAYTVAEGSCGVVLTSSDASSLSETLKALSERPEEVLQMGINARKVYDRDHSYQRAVDMFDKILSE